LFFNSAACRPGRRKPQPVNRRAALPAQGDPMPYKPTSDEVTGALSHVPYEVEQILGLLPNLNSGTDVFTKNARLEALLLHTRVLLDFFEHSERDKDDVLASDYGFPATPIQIEQILRERLNKDLAHLTFARQKRLGNSKGWDLKQLLTPLLQRFSKFADHIVKTRLSSLPTDQQKRWKSLAGGLKAY
jgi:hypothetical protein